MRYHPSLAFLLCLVPMLATGAVGGWIWRKADSVPTHVRAKSSFVEAFRYQEKPRVDPPTPEQLAQTRQAARELREKMEGEFPILKVEPHPVPDDENGFLQIYLLSPPPLYQDLRLSQEFRQMLNGRSKWNAEEAKRLLDEHSELVGKIEGIAAMKQRSSSNMPAAYNGFIAARATKAAADILLLKARLAAEAHDEKEAMRLVLAVANFSSHYRQVETPTLLAETVGILIDLSLRAQVFQLVLPALGRDADLVQWKEILKPGDYSTSELARVMGGEWQITSEFFLYPVILNPEIANAPPDPEALARVHAARFSSLVTRLQGESLRKLRESRDLIGQQDLSHLSARSRELDGLFLIGVDAWSKGFVRASVVLCQHQAAMDLLISEKAGQTLTQESVSGATREPIEGRSFVFDPASREINAPVGMESLEVQTLKLPW
jgi:hypothetical protein